MVRFSLNRPYRRWYGLNWPISAISADMTLIGVNRPNSHPGLSWHVSGKKKKMATLHQCVGSSGFVAALVLHRYTPMYFSFVLWKLDKYDND